MLTHSLTGIGPRADYVSLAEDSKGDLVEPTHETLNVNLIACMNTVSLGIHYMKKQEKGGSIVMTASGSSAYFFLVDWMKAELVALACGIS
jgi:hypothetical protein